MTDGRCDGLRMYEALYALWEAVQGHHPDVPDVMLYVTDNGLWPAHTAHGRWNTGQPEVYLTGRHLSNAYELLADVLHEAAHCALRNDPEARSVGRVHTWKFRNKAVEMGMGKFMSVEQKRKSGWGLGELQARAQDRYLAEVEAVTGLGLFRASEGS